MRVNEIYEGDCLDVMRQFPDNCIDSIITDPPYGLSFMGKGWDYGLPGAIYWREALRVAKPGSTLMAFGGSRTYHRLVCAIEDAGWEIRDCMMWIYGSGFPKSLDIGKAIDNANGAERETIGNAVRVDGRVPANERSHAIDGVYELGIKDGTNRKITAPSTPLAKQFDGWGTALKPSFEPIVVAQKPIDGTYAENAEKWGVSGIWVDGARIEKSSDDKSGFQIQSEQGQQTNGLISYQDLAKNQSYRPYRDGLPAQKNKDFEPDFSKGRWPANVIHDGSDEVEAEFAKAGVRKSREGEVFTVSEKNIMKSEKGMHTPGRQVLFKGYSDSGSASRYFQQCPPDPTQHPEAARFHYCPKASTAERSTPGNNHPTQKPLSLIRYLARLTKTPTGGIVLDPFAGSGTTALACISEGRDYILVEKEPEYAEICRRRITEYTGEEITPKEIEIAENERVKQLGLW